jgi:thioredoxin-dependent peroxiredoxin
MAIGTSETFPSAASRSTPTALGPESFFFAGRRTPTGTWARSSWAAPKEAVIRQAASATGIQTRYRIFGKARVPQFWRVFCARSSRGRTNDSSLEDMGMNINDKAPEFTLQDENGKEISLKALRGKTVILYFYPRADTPGCTIEACEFRDTYKQIQKTGAVLLGISPDTSNAQKKFADKFSLPFTLLADADKRVAEAFGVMKEKNMYGKKVWGVARTTFVIGPDGKIQHIFEKVKPEGHAEEVLAYLKESAKGAA